MNCMWYISLYTSVSWTFINCYQLWYNDIVINYFVVTVIFCYCHFVINVINLKTLLGRNIVKCLSMVKILIDERISPLCHWFPRWPHGPPVLIPPMSPRCSHVAGSFAITGSFVLSYLSQLLELPATVAELILLTFHPRPGWESFIPFTFNRTKFDAVKNLLEVVRM